jgi:uncharacterized membrane protein
MLFYSFYFWLGVVIVIARPLPFATDTTTVATPRQAATSFFHNLFSSLFLLASHHSTTFAICVVVGLELVAENPVRTCSMCALSFTFGREIRNTLTKTTIFPLRLTS